MFVKKVRGITRRSFHLQKNRKMLLMGLLASLVLVSYWFLPISGKILIVANDEQKAVGAWPQVKLEPMAARPGEQITLTLSDMTAWSQVKLLIANHEAQLLSTEVANNVNIWKWRFTALSDPGYNAVFYHDCQIGCVEISRFRLGAPDTSTTVPKAPLLPTKLGVVFADPTRDWHGKAGWDVELTYSQLMKDQDFSIDPLAEHVAENSKLGLRVLVRIDYDRGQALPPAGDEVALTRYLEYCGRLARDARFKNVYGYFVGSSFNRTGSNSLVPDHKTTPEWYARVFDGYGLPVTRTDNVVQTIHSVNQDVRVLVGPVTPWTSEQDGSLTNTLNAPWLNYMNTLVAHLNETTITKQSAGFALTAPDGFALQAPGRPEAVSPASLEPTIDVHNPQWGEAEFGFRIYRDWLTIINRYDTTRGLPVYITATNTYTPDTQIEPTQSYSAGWLTMALNEVDQQPQIQALCWYVDSPYDKWANYSLKAQLGQLKAAASEFDQLLQ